MSNLLGASGVSTERTMSRKSFLRKSFTNAKNAFKPPSIPPPYDDQSSAAPSTSEDQPEMEEAFKKIMKKMEDMQFRVMQLEDQVKQLKEENRQHRVDQSNTPSMEPTVSTSGEIKKKRKRTRYRKAKITTER